MMAGRGDAGCTASTRGGCCRRRRGTATWSPASPPPRMAAPWCRVSDCCLPLDKLQCGPRPLGSRAVQSGFAGLIGSTAHSTKTSCGEVFRKLRSVGLQEAETRRWWCGMWTQLPCSQGARAPSRRRPSAAKVHSHLCSHQSALGDNPGSVCSMLAARTPIQGLPEAEFLSCATCMHA